MPTRKAKQKVVTRRQRMLVEDRYILASMDVSALYSSLQWKQCAKEVKEAAMESEIPLEQFNWCEFTRYIALTCSDQEIQEAGIAHLIPGLVEGANLEGAGRIGDQSHMFTSPQAEPSEMEKRVLLGVAIEKGIMVCQSNHF